MTCVLQYENLVWQHYKDWHGSTFYQAYTHHSSTDTEVWRGDIIYHTKIMEKQQISVTFLFNLTLQYDLLNSCDIEIRIEIIPMFNNY